MCKFLHLNAGENRRPQTIHFHATVGPCNGIAYILLTADDKPKGPFALSFCQTAAPVPVPCWMGSIERLLGIGGNLEAHRPSRMAQAAAGSAMDAAASSARLLLLPE